MRVAIDVPARRSLTPNEQRVYKLLQEGLEPLEVARKLHMALRISNLANIHDVPPDTVMGLIASIREKGWEIPKINKEEDNMAKGQKTSPEKKDEVKTLRAEGKSQREISKITGVPQTTVHRICSECAEIKKEPAPSANDTSSKETVSTTIVPEIPADVNPCDEISDENFCCEVTGDTDMEAYMADREKFFAERKAVPDIVLEACREKRAELQVKIDIARADIKDWSRELREITEFLGANGEEVQQ